MSQSERATLGGGCFWCLEAVFERQSGVQAVTSGYAGGAVANPSYEAVCSGNTGHAEVIQVEYDPVKISYGELLDLFWCCHDPTTLNRQGADVGTQYRSVIFCHDDAQREAAEAAVKALTEAEHFKNPIVTQLVPAAPFWRAEDDHQRYYEKRGIEPTCHIR